jgi:hypothetical protein
MAAILLDPRDRSGLARVAAMFGGLWLCPHPIVVALSTWWIGNTVAHHAVHRRLFRSSRVEAAFAIALSLLLGVPQELWRAAHRAHHAERPFRWRSCRWRPLAHQVAALVGLHLAVLVGAWPIGVWGYGTGLAIGLVMAGLHGHYEHRGGITDVTARWWNLVFCNDGFHAAHHRHPTRHFADLPQLGPWAIRQSRLPPPLRWLAALRPAAWLDRLERWVLVWPWLQRRVLAAHRQALARVLADVPVPARVLVVGGGLFPRTAILLRERWPSAALVVLDRDRAHLELAQAALPVDVERRIGTFPGDHREAFDLVVLPLALRGRRSDAIVAAQARGASRVLVHDWLWRCPRRHARVAWWLGKGMWLAVPDGLTLTATATVAAEVA